MATTSATARRARRLVRAIASGLAVALLVTLIAFLAGIQLTFALLFGGGKDWVADITGFGAGFGLAFLVSPGGWAAVKRRVRRQ